MHLTLVKMIRSFTNSNISTFQIENTDENKCCADRKAELKIAYTVLGVRHFAMKPLRQLITFC